jgi:hypothetical protein
MGYVGMQECRNASNSEVGINDNSNKCNVFEIEIGILHFTMCGISVLIATIIAWEGGGGTSKAGQVRVRQRSGFVVSKVQPLGQMRRGS